MLERSSESSPAPVFGSLGTISLERLQLAADRHDLGRVLDAELLGGTYGNNVGVKTGTRDWVLRGAVAPIEAATLQRERFFARIIHERSSIAAPWPYLVDESGAIFGWAYAFMRRLRGKVLHPTLDVNWASVGQALGRAAAQLHAIRFRYIGEWRAELDDIASPDVSASQWFERRAGHLKQRIAQTSSALDATSAALVDQLIANAVPAIGEFEPSYIHGDLGIGNLVRERTSRGFAFTGVFDLGGGFAGDPDEDLATPIWWPLYWRNPVAPRAFLDSYRIEHPPRPGQPARLRAYVAFSMLANWEVGRRQGFDWYGRAHSFFDWALPLRDEVEEIIG